MKRELAPWGVSLLTKPIPQNFDQPVCSKQSALFTLNSIQKLGDVYNSNPVWCYQVTLSFKKTTKIPIYQHHVTHLKIPSKNVSVSWQNNHISEKWCSPEQIQEMGIYPVLMWVMQSLPTFPFPTLNTKQRYHYNIHTTSSFKPKLPHHWADESISALSCSRLTSNPPLQKQI